MYKDGFALAIVSNGRIAREEDGVVKLLCGKPYAIRLINKHDVPVAADVYVNGKLVNAVGQLVVPSSGSIDIDRFVDMDRNKDMSLVVEDTKKEQSIEVRFYKPKERYVKHSLVEWHAHEWPWFPLWKWPYIGTICVRVDDMYPVYERQGAIKHGDLNGYYRIVSTSSRDGSIVYTSSTMNLSNFHSDEGKEHAQDKKEFEGKNKGQTVPDTQQFDVVSLSLRVIGYDADSTEQCQANYCKGCGRKRRDENYCPNCGTKF